MKWFRLKFILLLAVLVAMAVADVWLFRKGMWPQATLLSIAWLVMAAILWTLVWKVVNVMTVFVNALEMNDPTMQFDFGTDNKAMRGLGATMNRIVELYRTNLRQLETSKLYYDRILKVMTHEMRNSITPVISLASDIEKHPSRYEGDNMAAAIRVIREESEGIKRFLDAYYRLTHVPQPKKEDVDAKEFFCRIKGIADMEETARGLSPGTCRFTVGEGIILNVDSSLIRQVMVNLLRNALDAVKDCDTPVVKITVSVSDSRPYISVEDNGCGIAPEIRENLFQPFISSKERGSGVGLSLSRQIVRQHGGELRLADNPSRGTTAVITFPQLPHT